MLDVEFVSVRSDVFGLESMSDDNIKPKTVSSTLATIFSSSSSSSINCDNLEDCIIIEHIQEDNPNRIIDSDSMVDSTATTAITTTTTITMPSLVETTKKRKRLDAVLTKLSKSHVILTNNGSDGTNVPEQPEDDDDGDDADADADEAIIPSVAKDLSTKDYQDNDDDNGIMENLLHHLPSKQSISPNKSPKKQLSVDSEMSMNVRQLNLNIGQPPEQTESQTLTSTISSTTKEIESSPSSFNTSSNLLVAAPSTLSSLPMPMCKASCTPPPTTLPWPGRIGVGGFLFGKEEQQELEEEKVKNDVVVGGGGGVQHQLHQRQQEHKGEDQNEKGEEEDEEGEEEEEEKGTTTKNNDDVDDHDDGKMNEDTVAAEAKRERSTTMATTMAMKMTTTVKSMMATSSTTSSCSDNLFGSHDFSVGATNRKCSDDLHQQRQQQQEKKEENQDGEEEHGLHQKQRLFMKKWPQATKLLSHDLVLALASKQHQQSRTSTCQNNNVKRQHQQQRQVPDTQQTRTLNQTTTTTTTNTANQQMAETLIQQQPYRQITPIDGGGTVSESVSSTTTNTITLHDSDNQCFNAVDVGGGGAVFKLPFFETQSPLSSSTSSSSSSSLFSNCKSSHCQNRSNNHNSGTMLSTIGCLHQPTSADHSWYSSSWHNLESSPPPPPPVAPLDHFGKFRLKPQLLHCLRQLSKKKEKFYNHSNLIEDLRNAADTKSNPKKRSYSDSDVLVDYLSVFKHATTASYGSPQQQQQLQHLPRAESGLILNKNGRIVPKPLLSQQQQNQHLEQAKLIPETLVVQSEHSTPQDSPLDLSFKTTLNAHQMLSNESHHLQAHHHHVNNYHRNYQYSNNKQLISILNNNNSCSSLPSLTSDGFELSTKNILNMLQLQTGDRIESSFKIPFDNETLGPSSSPSPSLSSNKRRTNTMRSSSESYSSLSSSVSSVSPLDKYHPSSSSSSSSPLVMSRNPFHIKDEDTVSVGSTASTKAASPTALKSKIYQDDVDIEDLDGKLTDKSITQLVDYRHPPKSSASPSSTTSSSSAAFSCTICGQIFSLHDRLAKHIASRHKNRQQFDPTTATVAKNYLCEICQRSFARSDMLTRHMRLHTGIKPYTCKICDQVFSRSDHLSTHQRTHTGEKPYKCPQCPYAACRRDMITRHMRTHSRYETPDSSSSTEELSK